MNVKNLVSVWALPDRTQERHQLTLRLNYDTYAKLHALKEVYKSRSVNDMINDLLNAGLNEVIESLPSYPIDSEDAYYLSCEHGGKPDDYSGCKTGPKVFFQNAYKRILEEKFDEKSDEKSDGKLEQKSVTGV